ncbi:MAG: hypothetical protein V4645_02880 [Pseudomonadota bacterium]
MNSFSAVRGGGGRQAGGLGRWETARKNIFPNFFRPLPVSQALRCRPRQATVSRAAHTVFHNVVPIGLGKRVISMW